MPVIPALMRLSQEFETNLGCIATLSQKKSK
jgi:hypothetical protein